MAGNSHWPAATRLKRPAERQIHSSSSKSGNSGFRHSKTEAPLGAGLLCQRFKIQNPNMTPKYDDEPGYPRRPPAGYRTRIYQHPAAVLPYVRVQDFLIGSACGYPFCDLDPHLDRDLALVPRNRFCVAAGGENRVLDPLDPGLLFCCVSVARATAKSPALRRPRNTATRGSSPRTCFTATHRGSPPLRSHSPRPQASHGQSPIPRPGSVEVLRR